jgi:hypothetical protein
MLTLKNDLQEYLSTLNPAQLPVAKSSLFNIFRASLWIERFYADGPDILAANYCKLKDLESKSGKKFDPDSKRYEPTPAVKNVRICTRWGSPRSFTRRTKKTNLKRR